MIVGIGCDMVEHKKTVKLGWDKKPAKLSRFFTQKELTFLQPKQKIRFLSGRFAAKEAVLKSLGVPMEDGVSLTDIQILQQKNGRPIVVLSGKIKRIAQKVGVDMIHLSISHTTHNSVAFAVTQSK